MRREQLPTPEDLYPRRVAVRAFELVLEQQGLKDVAFRLHADDPEQVFPGKVAGEVRLFERGWDHGQVPLAVVVISPAGDRARVVVEKVKAVVRPKHRKSFDLEELGIVRAAGEPDLDVEFDLSPILEVGGEAWKRLPARPPRRVSRGRVTGKYRSPLGRS